MENPFEIINQRLSAIEEKIDSLIEKMDNASSDEPTTVLTAKKGCKIPSVMSKIV